MTSGNRLQLVSDWLSAIKILYKKVFFLFLLRCNTNIAIAISLDKNYDETEISGNIINVVEVT